MTELIYVQFKNSNNWKTYCIWRRKDFISAKFVCLELAKTYSEVRIVDGSKKVIWRC